MSNKYRVLSVVLAVLLTVSAIMPETFFASANDGYINEDCSVKNTFDEENVVYSSEEIEADGKISYVTVNDEIGIGEYKLSRHGKFEENSGVADSNAVRFYQVRGSSETDKDVSYIRILNSEDSSYNWFVPDANSKYTVKISYKSEKNYNFVLREVGSFGEVNYDDNVLGTFEDETVENGWKVASAQFTTSKDTTSLYIAVATENGERDSEAAVYIDNIAVSLPQKVNESNEGATYSSPFNNVDAIKADGWKGFFSSDPQAGVAFTEIADSDYGNYYETWGGNVITRAQKSGLFNSFNNWNNAKTFTNMAALTYTAQKYKYFTFTVEYKYAGSGNPWPLVTFNQQNITPEIFYRASEYITNPVGSEDPIAVSPNYAGTIRVFGKKANASKTMSPQMDSDSSPQWHKIKISVTPESIYTAVYDKDGNLALELTTALDESYEGGYITLMQNGVSHFKNISITELEFATESDSNDCYSSPFNNVDAVKADGWKGFYSTDPQAGVPFTEIADSDYGTYYETWGGNVITRAQKVGKFNTYNNWNNNKTFTNMAALTYTAQKYKYFDLTVEYKFAGSGNPWPLVTFNQQNITPELFYRASEYITNPVGSEEPIAVSPNYAGSIRVFGKKASDSITMSPQMDSDSSPQWHKMKISVTPGSIYVAVYDKDGNLALELTTALDESYEGGYITLMQNGVSHFKNISITETAFSVINMEQREDSEVIVSDLDETQIGNTILISTKSKRWYDFKSVSAVSERGISYKISKFSTDSYKIESTEPLKLTVTYQKRELDYDPEYTLKYYFDWEEELEDFAASRTSHPDEAALEKVEVADIWKITDNILSKPEIDYSGTTQTGSYFADTNILMLKDIKFRNFELTLQYKHGKSGGYAGGIIFGIQDPDVFCNEADGGVFAMVESDARATLYGKSLRNADLRIIPGDGVTNLPGYPKWDTTQIHTMKLKVLDGRVEMIVDGANINDPAIGVLPKNYYGHIALAVANNKGWFDNLTIEPLDEWGNKITLAENEMQSVFNPDDIETDVWVDNSEWE